MKTTSNRELTEHLRHLLVRASREDGSVFTRVRKRTGEKGLLEAQGELGRLEAASLRENQRVLLEFRARDHEPMSRVEVTLDPSFGHYFSMNPRGCSGHALDGRWVDVRFVAAGEQMDEVGVARRHTEVAGKMAKAFKRRDKEAALVLVDQHGVSAVAEVLVSNRFGPVLFDDDELFELCKKYPLQHAFVSLYNGWAWLEGGSVKNAIKHLEHAAVEGSSEAKGTLARIYIEGDWIKQNIAKGVYWLSQIGFGKEDAAEDWFFGDEQFDGLPYDMSSQTWDWQMLCDLLNEMPSRREAKKAVAALPRSSQIERRWVVVE